MTIAISETQFKTIYISTFLASYMSRHYDEDCMNGHVAKREKNQPIEDAIYLADLAYRRLCQIYSAEFDSQAQYSDIMSDGGYDPRDRK